MLGEGIKIEAVNLMLPNGTVHVDDTVLQYHLASWVFYFIRMSSSLACSSKVHIGITRYPLMQNFVNDNTVLSLETFCPVHLSNYI